MEHHVNNLEKWVIEKQKVIAKLKTGITSMKDNLLEMKEIKKLLKDIKSEKGWEGRDNSVNE